jgi:hypothetical protein
MVIFTPDNFFEFLPPNIWEQLHIWKKVRSSLPQSLHDFATASFETGLIVDISKFADHYKNNYFKGAAFEKNSVLFAKQFVKIIKFCAARHKIKHLHIVITIQCDERKAVFPVYFPDTKAVFDPVVS